MVWGYIQYGGAREICKVDDNIDSAKYQQILASQYISNYSPDQTFCHMFILSKVYLDTIKTKNIIDAYEVYCLIMMNKPVSTWTKVLSNNNQFHKK